MKDLIDALVNNQDLAAALLAVIVIAFDIIAGKVPDRLMPYIGIVRRISEYVEKKKAGTDGT